MSNAFGVVSWGAKCLQEASPQVAKYARFDDFNAVKGGFNDVHLAQPKKHQLRSHYLDVIAVATSFFSSIRKHNCDLRKTQGFIPLQAQDGPKRVKMFKPRCELGE